MAFPTLVRTAVDSTSANATSFSPTWTSWPINTAISSGDRVLWVIVVSSDGSPTLSATGWTLRGSASNSTIVTGAIFTQETTGAYATSVAPSFTLNSTAGEQYTFGLLAFQVSSGSTIGFLLASAAAVGTSTNTNPPLITNSTGALQDIYTIATRSGDAQVQASAPPTGYTQTLLQTAPAAAGASTYVAEKQTTKANGVTEDPGTMTSASEDWVSWTFGVYEIAVTGINGSLSSTLGDVTGSSSAKLAIKATSGVGTLGAATVSATGKLALQATVSATLDAATSSSSAKLALQGTTSATLADVTLSSSGSSASTAIAGTLSATLDGATASSAGLLAIKATLSTTLEALGGSSAGKLPIQGSLTVTLGALSSSATGKLALSGAVTATLGEATSSGAAKLTITGSATASLDAVQLTSIGGGGHFGVASVTLAPLTGSASGALALKGSVASSLASMTGSASGSILVTGQVSSLLADAALSADAILEAVATPDPTPSPEPVPYVRPKRKLPWETPSSRNPRSLPAPAVNTRSSRFPLLLDAPSPSTPSSHDPLELPRPTFRRR